MALDAPNSKIDLIILNLLTKFTWLSRRAISGYVRAAGFDASTDIIFRNLNSLCRNERIYCSELIKGSQNHSIYRLTPWTGVASIELGRCKREIGTKCEALVQKITTKMGALGETYVRALLVRAGCYREITQWKKLGGVDPTRVGLPADLVARHQNPRIGRILIEVKNQEEHVSRRNDAFRLLLKKAFAQNALPILIASHIDAGAAELCDSLGIGYLELERQFVPSGTLTELHRCERVIYLPDLQPMMLDSRPFRNKDFPEWAGSHLATVRDNGWLEDSARRWRTMRPIIAKHVQVENWTVARRRICHDLAFEHSLAA